MKTTSLLYLPLAETSNGVSGGANSAQAVQAS
jgi:hypothetical protein